MSELRDIDKRLFEVDTAEEARELIRQGANVNAERSGKGMSFGFTPLMNVKNVEVAEVFLEAGANVNAVAMDDDAYSGGFGIATPLSSARDEKIAKLFIKAGAKIDITLGYWERPLVENIHNAKVLKAILETGAEFPDTAVYNFDGNGFTENEKKALLKVINEEKESRLKKKRDEYNRVKRLEKKVSGVVIADEIARKKISGKEKRDITPSVGEELKKEFLFNKFGRK